MARRHDHAAGPVWLDLAHEQLWRGVEALHLRPKSFAVLRYLVAHPGRVVAKDELVQAVWPETAVSMTLQGKKPGAGWEPLAEQLSFAQQAGSDIRPYDRLIGAALDGDRWLFARQDTVESAWEIVDPVLGDVVPAHPYARGSWGPKEADRLLPGRDTWHDPAG